MGRQKGMEFTFGKIRINMKVSGRITKGMVTAATFFLMEISMQVNMFKISLKVTVNINGLMDLFILAPLKMVWSMVKVNGPERIVLRPVEKDVTIMKANMRMIRSMALATSNGRVVTLTLAATKKMNAVDMVWWGGLTTVYTLVCGRGVFKVV
jgi:hypothetical protein